MRLRNLLLSAIMVLLVACGGNYEMPNGDNVGPDLIYVDDTGDDTGEPTEDPTDERADMSIQDLFFNSPFVNAIWTINHDLAIGVNGNWTRIQWLDIDEIGIWDASQGGTLQEFYYSNNWGNWCQQDGFETELYVSSDFHELELVNNGIHVFLQPDGTVVETTMLEVCEGYFGGWVSDFTDVRYGDALEHWGGHGGSQMSALPWSIRPGELTGDEPITHPIAIEVDHSHLFCSEDGVCHSSMVHAADSYALDEYSGTVEHIWMGGILYLDASFDCTTMQTKPAERICEAMQTYGAIIVDDPWGEDEVAFPVWQGVREEVIAAYGIDMHDADGAYHTDMVSVMTNVKGLTNWQDALVFQ